MTKEEIVTALLDDMEMPYLQDWQARNIVDFVIKNYRPSLPSNLDEAAEEYESSKDLHWYEQQSPFELTRNAFKAGAEWMARQGWHDATETPSIFGFYLVIHEKGWCVANYMGKGIVCESGWVEAIHHIEIERPQKWLDLRDLIPKKQ